MFNLDRTFYLNRANRYTNFKNENDHLPLVYGDLTDGSSGIWELPCINTANDVYCYAGHETLSVANGNTITIYADGVTVNPANYTFSHSNNYESEGVISTITFSTPPSENAKVTARGMGKPTVSGGATLMENAVDIVYDILVNEAAELLSYDFDATAKARARSNFVAQGYSAAGVIKADATLWTIITEIMASFKGEAYISSGATPLLVLGVDDGSLSITAPADIFGKGDIAFRGARLRRENIINRVPCSYSYNYAEGKFNSHTDASADSDTASIAIYGERRPTTPYQFYWCRDSASVDVVQALIITRQNEQSKVWEVEFTDNTLKRSHVDIGDYIAISFDLLFDKEGNPLTNELMRVLDVSTDLNTGTISFRCLDTGNYLTTARLLDGSWTLDGSVLLGSARDTTVY